MRPTSVADVAAMAGAMLVAGRPDTLVTGVVIDSRQVTPGALFVALEGERTHGALFAAEAFDKGAAAVLVPDTQERLEPVLAAAAKTAPATVPETGLAAAPATATGTAPASVPGAVIAASDPLAALSELSRSYRETLEATVIGVTGSTGKTTTKDLIAAALAPAKTVVASWLSLNNEIGVPLTLLCADDTTEVVVVEMAMRGGGQIAELARIAKPEIGVLTNVGVTHIELLGSEEAIADAKGELLAALPADGSAVVNGDDKWADRLISLTPAAVVRYGVGRANDLTATDVEISTAGLVAFTATNGTGTTRVSLPLYGRHNVYNALAALACARRLGVPLETAAGGLASARLSPMRLDVFMTADGVTVVNDCYNANPSSVQAALAVLAELPVKGRRIAVMGDMLELGERSDTEHRLLGERLVEAGVEVLITVGDAARVAGETALAHGLAKEAWTALEDAAAAADAARGLVRPGDTVLVKGSRAVGLERVVDAMSG